jgi:hypothetical protein
MPMESRDKPFPELRAVGPAALATRIRSGISLAQGRAALEELPARIRAQLQVLAARVRHALDVPSQREISDLARRIEEVALKLDALEAGSTADAGPSAAQVRDELLAELKSVKTSAETAARAEAAKIAAARVTEASATSGVGDKVDRSAPKATGKAGSKQAASGKGASAKPTGSRGKRAGEKPQRKTRSDAVANKTARKKTSS